MIPVNKAGGDWLLIKAWLRTQIVKAQSDMEGGAEMSEYHFLRGQIRMARALMDEVEPGTPPETTEDDYGISNPE